MQQTTRNRTTDVRRSSRLAKGSVLAKSGFRRDFEGQPPIIPRSLLPIFEAASFKRSLGISQHDARSLSENDFCAGLPSVMYYRATRSATAWVNQASKSGFPDLHWSIASCPLSFGDGWLGNPEHERYWRALGLPDNPREVFGAAPTALCRPGKVSGLRLLQIVRRIEAVYGGGPVSAAIPSHQERLDRLVKSSSIEELGWRDVRFGEMLTKIRDVAPRPVRALLLALTDKEKSQHAARMIELLETAASINVRDEIIDILSKATLSADPAIQSRNIKMIADRFTGTRRAGGAAGCSVVGPRFGLSGERARQIEVQAFEYMTSGTLWMPSSDKVISLIGALAPRSLESLKQHEELSALLDGADINGVLELRTLLGKVTSDLQCGPVSARFNVPSLWRPNDEALMSVIAAVAIRLHGYSGAIHVPLAAGLAMQMASKPVTPAYVEQVITLGGDFQWLDKMNGWGWLGAKTESRLLTVLTKIFAAAPEGRWLDMDEIHHAVCRDNKPNRGPFGHLPLAPPEVIRGICERLPNVEVRQQNDFRLKPGKHGRARRHLSALELAIVSFMDTRGGMASRAAMTKILLPRIDCGRDGLAICLQWSPIIRQVEAGIFSAVGRDLSIEGLSFARSERGATGSLSDGFRISSGAIRLINKTGCDFTYEVGSSAFSARQIHVPVGVARWYAEQKRTRYTCLQSPEGFITVGIYDEDKVRIRGASGALLAVGAAVGDSVMISATADGQLRFERLQPQVPS